MNYYLKYKLKKIPSLIIELFFNFIFFIPRKMYEQNIVGFKTFIDKKSDKRYRKRKFAYAMDMIFYILERDDEKICDVMFCSDYDNDLINDLCGRDYSILLDDDNWIKKNKLTVEKLNYFDYISKYYPEKLKKFEYYYWINKKNEIVYRIRM